MSIVTYGKLPRTAITSSYFSSSRKCNRLWRSDSFKLTKSWIVLILNFLWLETLLRLSSSMWGSCRRGALNCWVLLVFLTWVTLAAVWRIQCSTWWLRHGHLRIFLSFPRGFTGGTVVKTLPASARDAGSIPRLGRSLRRKWQLIPVFLPGKLHWQRSLTGYIRCDWAGTHAKFSVEGVCLVTQSCPTLCDPMDYSPLGSSVYGIFQPRILEWVAISFSRGNEI